MTDAVRMRSPAWVGQPDDDDEEVEQVRAKASSITSTVWWLGTTMVMLAAMLLHAEVVRAPWWLVAITAAEAYASFRRVALRFTYGSAQQQQQQLSSRPPKHQPRMRHFTSLRLVEGAPVDEIVARFLALDAMTEVRALELGSNTSGEGQSRSHSLGLLVSFAGHRERAAYLRSAERAEFAAFCAPFTDDTFVFDWESGGVV